ncbi:hypothetical protein BMW26_14425 [Microbacterium sp. 1.5R]|uniref:SDR family NAD(P)-dependent oxidoreductase n=1 Tax=Microbacterium sp. 1.5R TaxID=1916917 RepID=UPI00090C5164|nr:SDR family oxidoreductase [Microbacterium sp. 1.5R]APH46018.1 hypothetical protein BMW26_14425 [Microbacterium sp. 1.5R]
MKLAPFEFGGAIVVITGAASGMAEQVARDLWALGSTLFLIDRDSEGLAVLAQQLGSSPGQKLHTITADLASDDGVPTILEQVRARTSSVDLLVNVAGVAIGGSFSDLTEQEFDWVMRVNFAAPVALCRGLLPLLRKPGGHIANVSSVYGLIAPPGHVAYVSSKFALRGFSEVLRAELAGSGVTVTTIFPGGVRTKIAANARVAAAIPADAVAAARETYARNLTYPVQSAARDIVRAIRHRRPRLLIAFSAKLPDVVARLLPVSNLRVLARLRPTRTRNAAAVLRADD